MDKRKEHGEGQKREEGRFQPLASSEAFGTPKKSAQQTAKTLGISRSKVERARTVIDHGAEETKKAVEAGEMSTIKSLVIRNM